MALNNNVPVLISNLICYLFSCVLDPQGEGVPNLWLRMARMDYNGASVKKFKN